MWAIFFVYSMRERTLWRHHSTRNLPVPAASAETSILATGCCREVSASSVRLARALLQAAPSFLLDEPPRHRDPKYHAAIVRALLRRVLVRGGSNFHILQHRFGVESRL